MQELLQEMVKNYSDKIYRSALRYTGDRGQAEDLTQETFLRAYKNLSSFDRNQEAGPWLFKIATNLCRNWLRDNRETPVESFEGFSQLTENSPESIYFKKESEKDLALALNSLPQKYREVILLKHIGELSYEEICRTLDLELSLVKNRLYRGRLLLRDLLEKGSV
ncbi:MAG: sigma-70 family RNA polymerase sigma factor [Firmicutes bacterium]|nr:sigma-70 family RNA polymerase sigma factor [Bacillota bacterium]